MLQPCMTDMREHLMETLASLRDRENPMEPDRARAIAQVAGVLVDSAKAEVEFLKVTGAADGTGFIELPEVSGVPALPGSSHPTATGTVIPTGRGVVHKMRG